MTTRALLFETLKDRLTLFGKAVFGDTFSFEVDGPEDYSLTIDHWISVGVSEEDTPVFFWGMIARSHGGRDSPPEQDFAEEGNVEDTETGLDALIEAVLMRLVQLRMERQKDVLADEEEAKWFERA